MSKHVENFYEFTGAKHRRQDSKCAEEKQFCRKITWRREKWRRGPADLSLFRRRV